MPGIVGIIGSRAGESSLQKMCEKINHFRYIIEEYQAQGISLARMHCGYVNRQLQPVFSADRHYVCVMIGEIFKIDDLSEDRIDNEAQLFLDRFITEGISLLPKINGQYTACVFDTREQTAYLISDRYGSRPVYYATCGGSLFFAPETKALLATGVCKGINYAAFSDMFHFGHLFGYKTLFEGAEQLPDASVLIYKKGSTEIISYWDYPFDEASYSEEKQSKSKYSEQKELLKTVMKNSVDRQIRKNRDKLLIPLSGGLDSRFLAALSNELVGERIETFTMGGQQSEDQKYGAQVARTIGLSHRAFDAQPDDIWQSASFFSYLSDGMSPISGPISIHKPCIHYHHSSEILIAPQMCDTLFGSTLTRKSVKELRKNPVREWANAILTYLYNLMDENCLLMIFDKNFYQKYIKDHWKQIPQQYINRYPHQLHCYFMQLHREHGRRCTFSGNQLYNLYYDTRMPSYDNDLIDLAFRMPLPFKKNQNIYRFAFAEMFPELAKIKRERTHLPIDAPSYLIDLFHLCDKFLIKGKKIPVIENLSGRLLPPSYASFNQWFKSDLRNPLHTLLFDKRTLDRGIFNRDGVETLIRRHDKPTEDHSRLLWQMVNLEYFFRNFID